MTVCRAPVLNTLPVLPFLRGGASEPLMMLATGDHLTLASENGEENDAQTAKW